MKFDINAYMASLCAEGLEQFKKDSKQEICFVIRTESDGFEYGHIKSLYIKFSQRPEKVRFEFDLAISSLRNAIYAIRSMEFEVEPVDLHWHNITDSCWNLFGDKGFFVLSFKFHKKLCIPNLIEAAKTLPHG